MSHLLVFSEDDAATPILETTDGDAIAAALREIGVTFERWPTRALDPAATADDVLAAYAPEIEQLKANGGYLTADVLRVTPEMGAMRDKFLSEHTHGEDEVRFFVEGEGLFALHADGRVFNLVCTAGDLIAVPERMKHWADIGARPFLTVVRLFLNPEGWVATFTGNPIAERFPRLETQAA